jgi:adenylosuccinate lyase
MAIHVIDSEIYGIDFVAPEVREIFEEKSVVESWLMFEGILAGVQGELGIIPEDVAKEIKAKATLRHVRMERIVEIYRKTKLASVPTIWLSSMMVAR